jgi:glycogen debranching enzyme
MIEVHDEKKGDASDADAYYIQAASVAGDERKRVLKHGNTFAVCDRYGDFQPIGLHEQGLYHEGTRFVSCLLLSLGRSRPLFLSSTIKEDNDLLVVDLTNPDISTGGEIVIPRGTLHLSRTKFLWNGVGYEELRIRNYGLQPVVVTFRFRFEADFVDIFEVRGLERKRRGENLGGTVDNGGVTLSYRGLDDVLRRTRLLFSPPPEALRPNEAGFRISLKPQEEQLFNLTIACDVQKQASPLPFGKALEQVVGCQKKMHAEVASVSTSMGQFNDWVNRSVADLCMMTTEKETGPYPYAGVPWFSTPFGRDGIITALECLWLNPALARGVLAYLAANQARETNPERDAEPGKILHETRRGEMAALGEIPFGRYYGSIDATPLFIVLAGAYYDRTADRAFLDSIWPNIEAALSWIDTYGDIDGDGFVEYSRRSTTGLGNQGWKDSFDSVFHADGSLATGPIALCEVQAYVYAARRCAADLAEMLHLQKRADELVHQANILRERFERAFWCEDLQTYALALDGDKHLCRVRTSNAGHCLLTGIAMPDRARRVAQSLLATDSFSGWGVRTVATGEARYNPMSYHDGSVWPHDNALIASGFARYRLKDPVMQIMNGLFDASLFTDLHRLPELFCGFPRRPGEGPTLYPVACAPQAWAAAAVFQLLQACLGLNVSAVDRCIRFSYPLLPAFLKEVYLHNLRVGEASVDLLLLRHGHDVGINVLRREGIVEITMVK